VGAWGAFLRTGFAELAIEAESIIADELNREAMAFHHLRSLKSSPAVDSAMLKLAAILTHNVGDVDQGLSYWKRDSDVYNSSSSSSAATWTPKEIEIYKDNPTKFSRLAHERFDRFGGEFGRAKNIYKALISSEGHRNYPLREAKCLRTSPDLMLPIGPWLESWGRIVATHPGLSMEDRVQITRQLIRGCDEDTKPWGVPNQQGYFRALYGISTAVNFEGIVKYLDKECKAVLKGHKMRLHLGLSDQAFASKLGQQARDIL
jgi:hypothetical protein